MKMQWKTMAFVTGLVLVGSFASAAQLDSSAFTYKYEGDVHNNPGLPGYTENTGWATAPSLLTSVPGATDGKVLSFAGTTDATGGGYFYSTQWPGHPISNSTGWTAEFKIKVGTDASQGQKGAFGFTTNDGSASAGQAFAVGQSSFGHLGGTNGNEFGTSINTDEFHVFRLAQNPNDGTTYAWRDVVPVGSFSSFNYNYLTPEMYWGDGSGDLGGPTVLVDYVRFTPGFFEPVPEPSYCILMLFGVAGIWRIAAQRHPR